MRCNVSKEDFKSITVVHCYSDTVSIKVGFITLSFIRINRSYFELGMGIATGMSYLISWKPQVSKNMLEISVKSYHSCKASRISVGLTTAVCARFIILGTFFDLTAR